MNGSVFGLDMFRLLRRSKLTFNIHADSAQGWAGNIRMFEATGVGATLITEAAPNLERLFEPELEVVTYRNKEEAVEKIHYLLEHDEERERVALAGQRRTLRDHTAQVRALQLIDIIQHYLD